MKTIDENKLTLEKNKWYSWQMFPGYVGEPYFSPIKVHNIQREDENNIIELTFYNACYATGVRNFCIKLKILWHSEEYLFVEINPNESSYPKRSAIIGNITFHWLIKNILDEDIEPDTSISDYLDKYF